MFGLIFGCFRYFWAKKEYSLAVLGLSKAGKTTFVECVRSIYHCIPMPEKIVPTVGLNVIRSELNSIKLRMWDLSGETGMQKIWPNYTEDADAIVFCVDASDPQALAESKQLFESMAKQNYFSKGPLLLIANKHDKNNPDGPPDLDTYFGLANFIPQYIVDYKVVSCCSLDGAGVTSGISWLEGVLRSRPPVRGDEF